MADTDLESGDIRGGPSGGATTESIPLQQTSKAEKKGTTKHKEIQKVDAAQLHFEAMSAQHKEIFIGNIEGRNVYMRSEEDLQLFEEIKKYREARPTQNMDDSGAFDKFCSSPNGDAICKIVYRSRHPDYVLKFEEFTKTTGKYVDLRCAWEAKLVHRGFILVHELSFDIADVYVLVFASFEKIGSMAQARNLSCEFIHQESEITNAPPESLFQRISTVFSINNRIGPEASAPFRLENLEKYRGTDSLHPVKGTDSPAEIRRHFFRNAHRQLLTWNDIIHTTLTIQEIKHLPHIPFKASTHVGISQMKNENVYTQFFPIHDGSNKSKQVKPNLRTTLKKEWSMSFFSRQPIDKIREYFGERVALYFAFIGFYTQWLVAASIVGLVATIYGVANAYANFSGSNFSAHLFDNAFIIPFGAFMSIWATLFLEFWKRRNAYLAWWWDVMDFESEEPTRPEWYGTQIRKSPITGKNELHYPDTLRYTKMVVSLICVSAGVFIVIALITCAIVYRVYAHNVFGTCSVISNFVTQCVDGQTVSTAETGSAITCGDICWYRDQTACGLAGNISSPDPANNDLPNCEWIVPLEGNPYCSPACSYYPTNLACTLSYTSTPIMTRGVCQFVDTTYISTVTTALINLVLIQVLGLVFTYIAQILNDWENHRTDTIYEDALIVKTFFFNFLNSYTSLFYIAFFDGTLGNAIFGNVNLHDECLYGGCLTELLIQLAIIFLGQLFITKVNDVVIPAIKSKFRERAEQEEKKELEDMYAAFTEKEKAISLPEAIDPANEMQKPPQWIKDEKLEEFKSLFNDYNWLAIQFGYITLFVVSFPLAPAAGLINNFTEIRSDSYRLITRYQRPPAVEAQDIGTWYSVFNILGVMAVVTNAFIIAFSSLWVKSVITANIPDYTDTVTADVLQVLAYRLIIVLVFEHVIFALKIFVAWIVPDVPGPVQMAIDREKYLAKIALDGLVEDNPFDVDDSEVEGLLSKFKGSAL